MAIDPTKAGQAAWLLNKPEAVDALKGASIPGRDYDWARSLGAQALAEIAGATPAPAPEPKPEPEFRDPPESKIPDARRVLANPQNYPEQDVRWARFVLEFWNVSETPAPAPTPTVPATPAPSDPPPPPPTAGAIQIANDAALKAALKTAKGGEIFECAPGDYDLSLGGFRYGSKVTIKGRPGAKTGWGKKISSCANLAISGFLFEGKATLGSSEWLLMPENCDGLEIADSEFDGKGSKGGNAIFCRAGGNKRLTILRNSIHDINRALQINGASDVVASMLNFRRIGEDTSYWSWCTNVLCEDWDVAEAIHTSSGHPDIGQCRANKKITFRRIKSDAVSMGIDDFGVADDPANQDVTIEEFLFVTNGYENFIVFEKAGTTGSILNCRATTGPGGKTPRFKVPGGMKKSGNTIDGRAA